MWHHESLQSLHPNQNTQWQVFRYVFLRLKTSQSTTHNRSHNLHLISLLHLPETDLQDLHLSCHTLRKIPERLLQFIELSQQLSAVLRGQVLGVLRDKELNVESSCIKLRFGVSKGIFQLLNIRGQERNS